MGLPLSWPEFVRLSNFLLTLRDLLSIKGDFISWTDNERQIRLSLELFMCKKIIDYTVLFLDLQALPGFTYVQAFKTGTLRIEIWK